jgi:hypothetical protein
MVVAAGLAGGVATGASASALYVTDVIAYNPGAGVLPPRDDTNSALGAADGSFLSLGLGGDAIFGFGQSFGSPAAVFEITFGNRDNYLEIIDVWGILADMVTEVFLGTINNSENENTISFDGVYAALHVYDRSPVFQGRDGYDIDAIRASAVPLPAGGMLLLGGLGGLAALRRRKAKKA